MVRTICANPTVAPHPIPEPRPNKKFCSDLCKLQAHRVAVRAGKKPIPHRRPPPPKFGARVLPIEMYRPALFGYGDPPYPGKAHLYPEDEEVDHAQLIRDLVREFRDGWALSTDSASLGFVLSLCPEGVRVGSWHRQHRPYLERAQSWEPVIFCGGRRTSECVKDSVHANVPPRWDLPGRKPEAVYHWILRMLGARDGDTLIEPFPGSGAGADGMATFQAGPGRNVSRLEIETCHQVKRFAVPIWPRASQAQIGTPRAIT